MVRPEMMTAEAARVGEELRDARLALGATLEEVADSLRINRRYLAALEEGRSRDLPGPAYAVGFVRTYARALGLDADDMARRYRETGAPGRGRDLVFPEPVPERGIPAGVVLLLGAVIMVGAYAAWWRWSGSADRTVDGVPPVPARIEQAARDARQAAGLPPAETAPVLPPTLGQATPGAAAGRPGVTPPAPGGPAGAQIVAPAAPPAAGTALSAGPGPAGAAPSGFRPPALPGQAPSTAPGIGPGSAQGSVPGPGPVAAAPAAPAPPPPTTPSAPAEPPNRLTLRATDESWVQLRDPRSGQTVLNRVLRPGETYAVPREGLVLTTGKAQGLEIVVDGQPSSVLEGRTGVVRDVQLVPDQLRQPRPAPAGR
ncbi:RodZ domain-containing protein [Pararoseomonas sp. SCSIO 73927]|uniref:helix-turn-helix domain-containing protein n=1 Tax=Pararoseomonas sp. SCSIO 73927 TaxID=3114537 RepID=UPI0030CB8D04